MEEFLELFEFFFTGQWSFLKIGGVDDLTVLPDAVAVLACTEFKALAVEIAVLENTFVPDSALEFAAETGELLIDVSAVADECIILVEDKTHTNNRGLVFELEKLVSVWKGLNLKFLFILLHELI